MLKYWAQVHTIESALQYSVVWFYQELARRVGETKMKEELTLLDFGNKDISSRIDNFWLCGSLKISADKQVEFLRKLYKKN